MLKDAMKVFLDVEYMRPENNFVSSLDADQHTFRWKDRRVYIESPEDFFPMLNKVVYDNLYERGMLDLYRLDSIYRNRLLEKGIDDSPALIFRDTAGKIFCQFGNLPIGNCLETNGVKLGYDHHHEVIAVFVKPDFFRSLGWLLAGGLFFLLGFVGSLYGLYHLIYSGVRRAEVQVMGVMHLEHELRKPLISLLEVSNYFAHRSMGAWDASDCRKMGLLHARLCKIFKTTEMMLFAMKSGKLQLNSLPLDIAEVLTMIADEYRFLSPQAKISVVVDEQVGTPSLDGNYFACIISNLIDNALKYNISKIPEVHIYVSRKDRLLHLRVSDNGIGIAPAHRNKVFRHFYRVNDTRVHRATGFGLGLTFVYKVVDAYGGNVTIEGEEGHGTCFIIEIPVYDL